jgi:hypothetical protein
VTLGIPVPIAQKNATKNRHKCDHTKSPELSVPPVRSTSPSIPATRSAPPTACRSASGWSCSTTAVRRSWPRRIAWSAAPRRRKWGRSPRTHCNRRRSIRTGGDSGATLYCSAGALSNVAMRILGYMEWSTGLTTAGTWASGPTKIQLFGPGVKKLGDVVAKYFATPSSRFSTTSNTVQATNLSKAVTPQSAANLMLIRVNGAAYLNGSGFSGFYQILRAGSALSTKQRVYNNGTSVSDFESAAATEYLDAPGTTSSTSYGFGMWQHGSAPRTSAACARSAWGSFARAASASLACRSSGASTRWKRRRAFALNSRDRDPPAREHEKPSASALAAT